MISPFSLTDPSANFNEASEHHVPSPPQMPHSSSTASPPHSPLQSSSTVQFPSQSKFSSAYSHEPSS